MEYKSELIDFEKEDMESKKRMLGSDKVNIEEIKERCARWVELKSAVARNKGDYESIQDELNQLSSEIPVDIAYLLSIISQAEKALSYYAEESYLKSIGYSTQAIEALQAIRGN